MKSCIYISAIGDMIYGLPFLIDKGISVIYMPFCYADFELSEKYLSYEKVLATKPLLESQGFTVYLIHYTCINTLNVDMFISAEYYYHISGNPFDAQMYYFEKTIDINSKWIYNIKQLHSPYDIIVNMTSRYNNTEFSLTHYLQFVNNSCRIGFIGFQSEYETFVSKFNKRHVDYIQTDNLLQVAEYINSAKVFFGNSSSSLAIACAMGTVPIVHEANIEYKIDLTCDKHWSIFSDDSLKGFRTFIKNNNLQNIFSGIKNV